MAKERLLDIKAVMKALDTKQYDWYTNLSDEEKKEVSPWQLMRFMSSVQSKNQEIVEFHLMFVNDLVNVNFNDLREHPELQVRLMQIIGMGKSQFHPWIHPPKKQKADKVSEWLENIFPEYSLEEIEIIKNKTSTENLMKLARNHGMNDKEIKAIFG